MSRALARELGSRNITVNCVAPGFIDTDMTRALGENQTAALLQQIPLGRLGSPADIAHAVAFLSGPQAGYITGTSTFLKGISNDRLHLPVRHHRRRAPADRHHRPGQRHRPGLQRREVVITGYRSSTVRVTA
jgi:hypothetical protein